MVKANKALMMPSWGVDYGKMIRNFRMLSWEKYYGTSIIREDTRFIVWGDQYSGVSIKSDKTWKFLPGTSSPRTRSMLKWKEHVWEREFHETKLIEYIYPCDTNDRTFQSWNGQYPTVFPLTFNLYFHPSFHFILVSCPLLGTSMILIRFIPCLGCLVT